MSTLDKASVRATAFGFVLGAICWGLFGSRLANPADSAGALVIFAEIDQQGQQNVIHDPRRAGMVIALVVFSLLGGIGTAGLVRQRSVFAWMPVYMGIAVAGSILCDAFYWGRWGASTLVLSFPFGMFVGLLGVVAANRLVCRAR